MDAEVSRGTGAERTKVSFGEAENPADDESKNQAENPAEDEKANPTENPTENEAKKSEKKRRKRNDTAKNSTRF